jgi:DNA (cytosine-5)-methyltransferase 1
VFVVGCLGDSTSAGKVLFERQSLQRDSAPRIKKEQISASVFGEGTEVPSHEVAPCLETTCNDYSRADGFTMIVGQRWPSDVASTLNQTSKSNGTPGVSNQELFSQGAANLIPVPFTKSRRAQSVTDYETWIDGECAPTQNLFDVSDTRTTTVVASDIAVRRLTPTECERLQGFPDGYTAIPWRKKTADMCPDGPRYKALGNSMAVNCMAWIGERINALDSLRS